MIPLLRQPATPSQIQEMLQEYEGVIKIVVDIRRCILSGVGEMHADCESILLDDGSEMDDLWGANWYPGEQRIEFESLINIRPRLGNRNMVAVFSPIELRFSYHIFRHMEFKATHKDQGAADITFALGDFIERKIGLNNIRYRKHHPLKRGKILTCLHKVTFDRISQRSRQISSPRLAAYQSK